MSRYPSIIEKSNFEKVRNPSHFLLTCTIAVLIVASSRTPFTFVTISILWRGEFLGIHMGEAGLGSKLGQSQKMSTGELPDTL